MQLRRTYTKTNVKMSLKLAQWIRQFSGQTYYALRHFEYHASESYAILKESVPYDLCGEQGYSIPNGCTMLHL
uniref:Uncharacterized protein n=1 Tax=Arundo donax TaxID=35708 RepID=A0A0A9D4G4_ARUDO